MWCARGGRKGKGAGVGREKRVELVYLINPYKYMFTLFIALPLGTLLVYIFALKRCPLVPWNFRL